MCFCVKHCQRSVSCPVFDDQPLFWINMIFILQRFDLPNADDGTSSILLTLPSSPSFCSNASFFCWMPSWYSCWPNFELCRGKRISCRCLNICRAYYDFKVNAWISENVGFWWWEEDLCSISFYFSFMCSFHWAGKYLLSRQLCLALVYMPCEVGI